MLDKASGHWAHFRNAARPGAGFDADLGRPRSAKAELAMRLRDALAALRGATTHRHAHLFRELWPAGPIKDVPDRTPIAYLAGHFANKILTHLPQRSGPLSILEIGAGSGYLTHLLLEALPGSTACIVDLPEILAQGRANLARLGTAPRVTFMPAAAAAHGVPAFDIAVNTASFQEMLPETIAEYFALIRQSAKPGAVLYCCNRVEKWLSLTVGNSDADGARHDIPVRFADYPWGKEKDLFYRVSQMHRRLGMEPCQERLVLF